MQYEYLFTDRKRIGSNIAAIMKDRKCTKVTLSQAMNISRPTLDAFLKGEIHNANKYDEYIKRLLVYMQVNDSVLDNYKLLPDIKKLRCNSVQKVVVKQGLADERIETICDLNEKEAQAKVEQLLQQGKKAIAISYRIENAMKIVSSMAETYADAYIGVMDIANREAASIAVDSGARFIMTAFTIAEVGTFCKERDVCCVMGAMTLSECHEAFDKGSDIVNLYPIESIAMDTVKAVQTSLPDVTVMITANQQTTLEKIDTKQFYATMVR